MNDFGYYALVLVVLVVGLFVLKKVATCMIKAMVAVVMVASSFLEFVSASRLTSPVRYWLFC